MAVALFVGDPGGPADVDVSEWVQFDTVSIEDTGNQTDDTAAFEIMDKALSVVSLYPEGPVLITHDGDEMFIGFIQNLEPAWEGIGRRFRISCAGVSMLLDKCIIPASGGSAYRRAAGESDRTRIQWLLNTFGQPFLDAGSSSFTKIQTLDADMEKQDFQGLTLRQAIERVLGAASNSSNYYVDAIGRVHTFDDDNPEPDAAPFTVNATPTLAVGEVAPSDLRINWDTSELLNYYFVKGKTAAASGAYSDADSIAAYGRRQAFIAGPDADTIKKAKRLGRAALSDTKDPIIRANFSVEDDYCENGSGLTWKPGQVASLTSAAHDLEDYELRIVRTTTSYLNSLGARRIEIELGALRASFPGGIGGGAASDPGGSGRYPGATTGVWPEPDGSGGSGSGVGGGQAGCGCPIDMDAMLPFDDFERADVGLTVGVLQTGVLGSLPLQTDANAWWPGGNEWKSYLAANVGGGGIADGVFYVHSKSTHETSGNNFSFALQGSEHLDGPFPEMPLEMEDWEILVRWRLTGSVGVVADPGLRYIYFDWMFSGRIQINLGDGTYDQGIMAIGDTIVTVDKAVPAPGEWGLLRMRWQDDVVYGKFWAEDEDEPVWDVSAPLDLPLDPTALEFDIVGRLGNASGPVQRIEIDHILVSVPAAAGELVERSVPHGSGGIIDVGGPFEAGTLTVLVDDTLVIPDSEDAGAGTADLGYELDHDPDNHPAGCSDVRVTYRVGA
jgi:hypothetical protein